MTTTTAEQDQSTAAAPEGGRADKPRVGDLRRQHRLRPRLAGAIDSSAVRLGRRAGDRSSRGARAVVAPATTEAGLATAGDSKLAGLDVAHGRQDVGVRVAAGGDRADTRPRKAATRAAHRALYAEALALIRVEYGGDLRLTDVARRIGASPRALQRAFADNGKRSFSEELRATRLNVAARLLRTTDLPVGEIARRVGYRDHAPFTKAFRRHHGTAPRAHRLSR